MARTDSILFRILSLHLVVVLGAACVIIAALHWMLDSAAQTLHERALRTQAEEIGNFIETGPGHPPRVRLPARLGDLYLQSYGRYAYAVLDADGQVLASSLPRGDAVDPGDGRQPTARYFSRYAADGQIAGLSLPWQDGEDGPRLWIQVAQDMGHRDVLIDDIVDQFYTHAAWVVVPIMLLLLAADGLIIRRALSPIIQASREAERIGPLSTEVRLTAPGAPLEVRPLIAAVNQALERLDRAFRGQRDFTADAAHELRTPLTVLRTRIETALPRETAAPLIKDIDGMSRLIQQLLDTAQADSLVIHPGEQANLRAVAEDVVALLTPLALRQDRQLAVGGEDGEVPVRGNADALFHAVRNLVENALRHTPPGSTVEVRVRRPGLLQVADQGPGVPAGDRPLIFRRFWRRDRRHAGSAGLGLAIVARVAEAHGGTVTVSDADGGGAVFTLSLPADPTTP